jgi:hypothetical protein
MILLAKKNWTKCKPEIANIIAWRPCDSRSRQQLYCTYFKINSDNVGHCHVFIGNSKIIKHIGVLASSYHNSITNLRDWMFVSYRTSVFTATL